MSNVECDQGDISEQVNKRPQHEATMALTDDMCMKMRECEKTLGVLHTIQANPEPFNKSFINDYRIQDSTIVIAIKYCDNMILGVELNRHNWKLQFLNERINQ